MKTILKNSQKAADVAIERSKLRQEKISINTLEEFFFGTLN
jgi:hypothetical protein